MNKHKVVGFILISLSAYYIYHYARLWYLYEFTDILWFMMLLTWEIIMNLIIGLIGMFIGIKVFKHSMTIFRGTSISIALMILSQIITFLIVHR